MYKGKKISVAMATYNGEKYIEEQLLSILNQTVPPDEIIISDDGSKDKTLDIVYGIDNVGNTEIKVITDNPNHGFGGNFEWAVKHCTGDLIFYCDQDDVWYLQKVETVTEFYDKHPQAMLVFHNAIKTDATGNTIDEVFNQNFSRFEELCCNKEVVKLNRSQFLEFFTSCPGIHGMVMCFRKELLQTILPFPKESAHDNWTVFCACALDECWFMNKVLGTYRLHGGNATAHSRGHRGNVIQIFRRIKGYLAVDHCKGAVLVCYLGREMLRKLEELCLVDTDAYLTAKQVVEIGKIECDAMSSGRVTGIIKLHNLYRNNLRYHNTGRANYILQSACIAINGKKARKNIIDQASMNN